MADNQVLAEVSGLQTSNNTFTASPPGALLRADECVMPQKGVIQPRNGQDSYTLLPAATAIPFAMVEFLESVLSNNLASKTDAAGASLSVGASAASGGPYAPVDCDGSSTQWGRMKFGLGDRFLYFCTTTGPKAMETIDTPRSAGLLRMNDPRSRILSLTTVSQGWLEYGSSVAYRSVCVKPTASGVSLLSPPSGRTVVANRILAPPGAMVRTGGTTVTVTIPGQSLAGGLGYGLGVGDTFDLTPGEADFPAGTYTVATSGPGIGIITYTDAGANVSNTIAQDLDTGPRAVRISVEFSPDVTTTTPVRVYRSLTTASENLDPSDEMFLVAEFFPSSGEITAGFKAIDDTTPDSVLSDPLYTNPQTGEGASQSNNAPPIYRDLAWWGSRMWYLQTTNLHEFKLQMLGVGAPSGVQANDMLVVTLGASVMTLTFKATAGSAGEVSIVSDSTPSANIRATTLNLVEEMNDVFVAANVSLRAYYNSEQDGQPGKVLIQSYDYEEESFEVSASRVESWAPALPADSTAEYRPNGLDYSKLGQSEAVPPTNRTAVGSANFTGARLLALQNALLVFKRGDGIWAVTGNAPFQVQQISVANIIAPDTAVVFADAAWVCTDQGILRVSDAGGAVVVSRPIETELNELRALFPTEMRDYAFAVAYETERRVMFFVPFDVDADGFPVLCAYCYNNATEAWSGPLYAGTSNPFSGVVSPSQDKLMLGVRDTAWGVTRVTRERKGNDPSYGNHVDARFAATISAIDVGGDPLVIALASVTDVEAGDGISQGVYFTKIRSVDGNNLTLYEELPFTAASCFIFKHYDVVVQFQPSGHPTSRKALTKLSFIFKPGQYEAFAGRALVMTDQIQAELEVSAPFKGFGSSTTVSGQGFGQTPFGDPSPLVLDVNPINAKWTNAAQFFVGFAVSEAWPKLKLQGFSATITTQDAPVGRGQ